MVYIQFFQSSSKVAVREMSPCNEQVSFTKLCSGLALALLTIWCDPPWYLFHLRCLLCGEANFFVALFVFCLAVLGFSTWCDNVVCLDSVTDMRCYVALPCVSPLVWFGNCLFSRTLECSNGGVPRCWAESWQCWKLIPWDCAAYLRLSAIQSSVVNSLVLAP